jgi:hypothetical protein
MFTGFDVVMLQEVGSAGPPPLIRSPTCWLRSPPKGSGPPSRCCRLSTLDVEVTRRSCLRSQPWSDAPSHRRWTPERRYMRCRLRLLLWPPKGAVMNQLDGGTLSLKGACTSVSRPTSSVVGRIASLLCSLSLHLGTDWMRARFRRWAKIVIFDPMSAGTVRSRWMTDKLWTKIWPRWSWSKVAQALALAWCTQSSMVRAGFNRFGPFLVMFFPDWVLFSGPGQFVFSCLVLSFDLVLFADRTVFWASFWFFWAGPTLAYGPSNIQSLDLVSFSNFH